MAAEKPAFCPLMAQHRQELMGYADLYSWEPIRAFHAIWLQQLEQGRVTWDDKDAKVKFSVALSHSAFQTSLSTSPTVPEKANKGDSGLQFSSETKF